MQTLKLAGHLMPSAKNGDKKVTIRKDLRPIALGDLKLENAEDPNDSIVVQVFSASCVPFHLIPLEMIQADGGASHEEMMHSMRKFYPDMDWETASTVVCWK